MNSENLQLIIIILLLVILTLILGLGLIAFKHFSKKGQVKPIKKPELKPVETSMKEGGFCEKHPGRPSVGICNICEVECCQECLKEIESLHLCPAHFKEVLENEWIPITNERTSADNPEKGIYIYEFKKNLWNKSKVPTYIQSHYKIDVEKDEVETYVQLHVKKDDEKELKNTINKFKDTKSWPSH